MTLDTFFLLVVNLQDFLLSLLNKNHLLQKRYFLILLISYFLLITVNSNTKWLLCLVWWWFQKDTESHWPQVLVRIGHLRSTKFQTFLLLGSFCEERYIVECLWRKVCKTGLCMDKEVWDQMKVWHLVLRRTGPKAQKECAITPCERCSAKCTMGAHQGRIQPQSRDRENSIGR